MVHVITDTHFVKQDVRFFVEFKDDQGNYLDPDANDATITISLNGTAIIDGVSMTRLATGQYEYWWDTATEVKETYESEIEADFSAHTEILRRMIELV